VNCFHINHHLTLSAMVVKSLISIGPPCILPHSLEELWSLLRVTHIWTGTFMWNKIYGGNNNNSVKGRGKVNQTSSKLCYVRSVHYQCTQIIGLLPVQTFFFKESGHYVTGWHNKDPDNRSQQFKNSKYIMLSIR